MIRSVLVSSLLLATSAFAADQTLIGKKLQLSDKGAIRVDLVLTAPVLGTADPLVSGAHLSFIGGGGLRDEIELPASGWTAKGAKKAYRSDSATQSVTATLVDGKIGKIRIRGSERLPLGAAQHGVSVFLTVGDTRFCASFGGRVVLDEDTVFKAGGADAPATCASGLPLNACDVAADCGASVGACGHYTCSALTCAVDIEPAGTVCRVPSNECESELACDGVLSTCPADPGTCKCTASPGYDAVTSVISTSSAILDLTTGQTVSDASLLSNLQTSMAFTNGWPQRSCEITVPLKYGCYAVEYLLAESNLCVTPASPRVFKVTATQVGVSDASVDVLAQLGGYERYYPGAYTAAGPVLDGSFRTSLTQVSGDPFLSGLVITPLFGCSIPLPPPGTPSVQPGDPPIKVDFGTDVTTTGVTWSCDTTTTTTTTLP